MNFRTLFVVASALLIDLTPVSGYDFLPRNLIQQGERFLNMGKYPAAMDRYSQVITKYPGTIEASEAHNDIGVIHARQGDIEQAIKSYEAALKDIPFPLAHFNLGKILVDRFRENQDPETCAQALMHMQAFHDYLLQNENLPPIITYQRDEIDMYLEETLVFLSSSR